MNYITYRHGIILLMTAFACHTAQENDVVIRRKLEEDLHTLCYSLSVVQAAQESAKAYPDVQDFLQSFVENEISKPSGTPTDIELGSDPLTVDAFKRKLDTAKKTYFQVNAEANLGFTLCSGTLAAISYAMAAVPHQHCEHSNSHLLIGTGLLALSVCSYKNWLWWRNSDIHKVIPTDMFTDSFLKNYEDIYSQNLTALLLHGQSFNATTHITAQSQPWVKCPQLLQTPTKAAWNPVALVNTDRN